MVLTQLVLFLQFKCTESASTIALPDCPESCGGIPIPYPFGIGKKCSPSLYFNVTCDQPYYNGTPTPYLFASFPILNISLSLGHARVGNLLSYQCYNTATKKDDRRSLGPSFSGTFWVNTEKNKFTVIGCNTLAYLFHDSNRKYPVGCLSWWDSLDMLNEHRSCSGIGCCQIALPKETSTFYLHFDEKYNNSDVYQFSPCSYAMVVEEDQFKFDPTYITTDRLKSTYISNSQPLPMVLDWAIGNTTCDIAQNGKSSYVCRSDHSVCLNATSGHGGYLCNCSDGYEGNPYLDGGCQGHFHSHSCWDKLSNTALLCASMQRIEERRIFF